jgi:beta-lactamase regulating signal transducer with metallopeptidase domain
MTEVWTTAARWLAHTAVAGGVLLLLVYAAMALVRQPVRRQRLGEWGTGAALLCAVLALAPSWLHLSLPRARETAETTPKTEPIPTETPPETAASGEPGTLDVTTPAAVYYYYPVEGAGEPAAPPAPVPQPMPSPAAAGPSLNLEALVPVVVMLYALGAALLFGRWLIGTFLLWRLVCASRPAPQPAALLFAEMAGNLRPVPRLLVARRLRVPVSCGLWRPTVLVPAVWCRRPAELRWVFAHELTHLKRRDAWSCLLFGLAQVVFFYLPWFWGLRRQVRLCQEYVADAVAAEQPWPVEDYAQFLLGLTMAPAVPVGATGVLGNSSDLYRRVTMLLQSPISVDKRCPRLWLLSVAGGLLSVAVFAAGVGLRAEPSDPVRPAPPAADEPPAPARPVAPVFIRVQRDDPAAPPVERVRVFVQDADRKPVGTEEVQKEVRKAVEEAQKALQQLQKIQLGTDPERIEEIQKEVQKAMEEVRKAMAQEQDLRKRLGGARRALDGQNAIFWQMRAGNARLGAPTESPSAALVDQLGLNKAEGQVLTQVPADSAAAKAGLQANDILLQLGGKPVPSDTREFAKLLDGIKANVAVEAVVLRKGKKETVKGLTLPDKPERLRVLIQGMPPMAPIPGIPGAPGFPIPGPMGVPQIFGLQALANPQNAVITTTVRTTDGFTTRYQEGSLIITLTGSTKDGKAKVNEIHVQDGNVANKYESLDKVPKQYHDKVKNLVEMSEKSGTQIEIELKK